jgi:hypothetical protein
MNNYITSQNFNSTIVEGLTYKLKKISQRRRMAINQDAASEFMAIRDARTEGLALEKEHTEAQDAAKLEPCTCSGHEHEGIPDQAIPATAETPERTVKDESRRCNAAGCECRKPAYRDGLESELVDFYDCYNGLHANGLHPKLIKLCVTEVSGIEIDGEPVTVDSLLAEMPGIVIMEVGGQIEKLMAMPVDQQLGFKQPGTLSAPVAGPTKDSSAETASA